MSKIPRIPPDEADSARRTQSPDTTRKISQVEKISEVDEDATRRQKFRDMVDAPEETPSDLPSPLEISSSRRSRTKVSASAPAPKPAPTSFSSDAALQDSLNRSAVPGVAYSPSPNVWLAGTSSSSEMGSSSSLPQSSQVWYSMDEPPQPDARSPTFEELKSLPSSSQESSQESSDEQSESSDSQETQETPLATKEKSKRANPANPFTEGLILKEKGDLKGKADIQTPTEAPSAIPAPFYETGQELSTPGMVRQKGAEHEKLSSNPNEFKEERQIAAPLFDPKRTDPRQEPSHQRHKNRKESPLAPHLTAAEGKEAKERERGDKEGKKRSSDEQQDAALLQAASLTPIPLDAIPQAYAAAQTAAPYLGPEALAIYTHMIGMIVSVVKPSGDSQTEFILNSPALMNSKFYGAKIVIEKFESAPNAVNIRLTGSEEAVKEFQQNIPNLLAVFEKGKFAFTINRLEAVYEKPLFQRKEKAKDKGDKERFKEEK